MNDAQLYLVIGLQVFAVLMGFVGTVLQVDTINARISSLEAAVKSGFDSLESRFNRHMSDAC
jgi:hypothetical protein